ncbi:very short patch repair endonuclease [Geobacter benzoatilyticus]|uniref:Very short patch repair endonuclease n=1 Tax=Geobacter benzoatilyticus TaxID=2815309 RepID=A0ABX7Q1Q2_9BACT|nr:very short patch repair endonuclease [Geobacter benzoatilyticus]QSV45328.1 DNA mismatch endonuclease Vsr [Geobacter benzoatilyticus]
MADVVNAETRSRMMSGIRGKNTKPEILIRSLLHRRGFRFRLHDKKLPGKPDIVLPRYRAVIMIHGCFWHGHDCHLFKWPSSNESFWKDKISRNKEVDARSRQELTLAGWRILTVWECALKGKHRRPLEESADEICTWLVSSNPDVEIKGVILK